MHTYILSVTMPRQISKIVQRAFNFRPDILDFFALGAEGNHDSFIQLVTLNSAVGRGYLKLKDTNPFTYPEINPRYLESEEDSSALLEGNHGIVLITYPHCIATKCALCSANYNFLVVLRNKIGSETC